MKKVREDIRKGEFHPVYLLYGDEAYLRMSCKKMLQQALVASDDTMNLTVFTRETFDAGRFIDQAETMPFFAEHRLILAEDTGLFKIRKKEEEDTVSKAADGENNGSPSDIIAGYLPQMPPETIVVFVEDEVDKRSRLYKCIQKTGLIAELNHPDEKQLSTWILGRLKKENKVIRTSTMEYFLSVCGNDMEHIDNELEKLFSYTLGRSEITRQDIEEIGAEMTEVIVFRMIDEIMMHHQKKALEMYYGLVARKEPSMRILYLLGRQFNQLLMIRELSDLGYAMSQIAAQTGLQSFVVRKGLELSRKADRRVLRRALQECVEADTMIKTGKIQDQIALEMLIIKYSAEEKNTET